MAAGRLGFGGFGALSIWPGGTGGVGLAAGALGSLTAPWARPFPSLLDLVVAGAPRAGRARALGPPRSDEPRPCVLVGVPRLAGLELRPEEPCRSDCALPWLEALLALDSPPPPLFDEELAGATLLGLGLGVAAGLLGACSGGATTFCATSWTRAAAAELGGGDAGFAAWALRAELAPPWKIEVC